MHCELFMMRLWDVRSCISNTQTPGRSSCSSSSNNNSEPFEIQFESPPSSAGCLPYFTTATNPFHMTTYTHTKAHILALRRRYSTARIYSSGFLSYKHIIIDSPPPRPPTKKKKTEHPQTLFPNYSGPYIQQTFDARSLATRASELCTGEPPHRVAQQPDHQVEGGA